jgi:hypothetical protein
MGTVLLNRFAKMNILLNLRAGLRDRDAIFGDGFREQVRDMGFHEVLSAPRSPWQRAYGTSRSAAAGRRAA